LPSCPSPSSQCHGCANVRSVSYRCACVNDSASLRRLPKARRISAGVCVRSIGGLWSVQALAKAETTLQIALNGNSTLPYPFLMDVRIARETGHDGVIVVVDKLRKYLSEGFSLAEARAALAGLPVLGLSNVRDIERASKDGRARLLAECEESCRLAEA